MAFIVCLVLMTASWSVVAFEQWRRPVLVAEWEQDK